MTRKAGSKPRTIRSENLRVILDLYKRETYLSVSDISSKVRLSRTTISKINEKLLSLRLIKTCGKGDSTEEGGKKPELYCLDSSYGAFACFHIREGYISVKYYDMNLSVTAKIKVKTGEEGLLEEVTEKIADETKRYISDSGASGNPPLLGISVAVHGIVDSEKGMCLTAPHFPAWGSNRDIRKMISDLIEGVVPVHVESWIRFKAYSAKRNQETELYRNYILLDAGLHGIVAGVVLEGRLLSGSHYLSGEIGHTIVSASESEKCYCGGKGCLETFIDCKRLVSRAIFLREEYPDSSIFRYASNPDIFTIFEESNRGDALACMLMDEIAGWFAIGLSNVCLMFDPEVIYFEGDYSTAGKYFEEKLMDKIKNVSLVRLEKEFRIIFHAPENNATALGAGAFARDYYLSGLLEI